MPVRWTIEDQRDHLLVRVEGRWHFPSIRKLIDEMGRTCSELACRRVFCDLRAVVGTASEQERYVLGIQIADRLQGTRLVVVASPAAFVNQFAVKVANRRGAQMFVTVDLDEARRWLFEEGMN